MIKRLYFGVFLFGLLFSVRAYSVVPVGYYDATDGQSGAVLKTKLYDAIKGHTQLTYGDLWTAFRYTDVRADDKVWDIYSNSTNYIFGTNQDKGSGGSTEGELYNREHSFPNSWFGGVTTSPMYTDLFHLYPSDKWVNNSRGNRPFGNVKDTTGHSANKYSVWGTSTESGSSLAVFAPADELKGDMARSYFYMVTRYENVVGSWKIYPNTEMLGGNAYPAFSDWAIKVLLEWSRLDPVSAKERARNDVIYANYQHNRNPYIDFPSLAEYVWGDSTTYAFHPSKYTAVSAVKSEVSLFSAWSGHGNLRVRTTVGKTIEIMDVTGKILIRSDANQIETTFQSGNYRLLLVRVDNQVQKVIL